MTLRKVQPEESRLRTPETGNQPEFHLKELCQVSGVTENQRSVMPGPVASPLPPEPFNIERILPVQLT
jgi:hypothetical protein